MKRLIWHYPHLKFWMGGTKHVCELITIFNKEFKAKLICNLGDKLIINKFSENNIKVITTSKFCTNDIIYWALFPLFVIYDTYKSYKHLKNNDIVLATVFPSNLICAICTRIQKKDFYYYCFEPFPFFHNQELINDQKLVTKIEYKILSFLYGWTDIWATRQAKKIFTSDWPKQNLINETYNKPSILSPVGVDIDFFKPYANNPIKEKYKNKIIITHSTDYTPLKRTDLAIKAISRLVKQYPKILLLITSTKPDSPEKQKYIDLIKKLNINDNAKLLGLVPFKDVPLYYGASLCYLSTSYNKMTCTNLPVKESAACGTPIIRADVPGEIDIENNVSGFIIDTQKPVLVSQKIKFLIEHPEITQKMGQEARKSVVDKFTWQKGAEIVLSHINLDN